MVAASCFGADFLGTGALVKVRGIMNTVDPIPINFSTGHSGIC